jgi:hypothetical protein
MTDGDLCVAETQLLFAAARDPKELWLVPDAEHVDFLRVAGTSTVDACRSIAYSATCAPATRSSNSLTA